MVWVKKSFVALYGKQYENVLERLYVILYIDEKNLSLLTSMSDKSFKL